MTSVLILAAGTSRRLGRPKQTEVLGRETLIERALRVAIEAALGPVHVVLRTGDSVTLTTVQRSRCGIVFNDHADEGMASSVRAGVHALSAQATALLIMTCDQPAVTPQHLRRLAAHSKDAVTASIYDGRRGVPACFPARTFPELLQLRGDVGARDLLRNAEAIELIGGGLDIDTAEDLANARSLFAGEEQDT